jgi:hypothetical protein
VKVPDATAHAQLLTARQEASRAWDLVAACANQVDTAAHALQSALASAHVAQMRVERIEEQEGRA